MRAIIHCTSVEMVVVQVDMRGESSRRKNPRRGCWRERCGCRGEGALRGECRLVGGREAPRSDVPRSALFEWAVRRVLVAHAAVAALRGAMRAWGLVDSLALDGAHRRSGRRAGVRHGVVDSVGEVVGADEGLPLREVRGSEQLGALRRWGMRCKMLGPRRAARRLYMRASTYRIRRSSW